MLDPRWRKVLRDVWLHKARTLLVVSAISIGIIGAGSVLDAWSLLRRVTRQEFDASNPASATIRTDSIDEALLSRVRALPAIAAAQARRSTIVSFETPLGSRTALLIASPNFPSDAIGVIKADGSGWPPRDSSIVLEHSSVEFAGLREGDAVRVQLRDAPSLILPVRGIARDVGLAPGWMEHVVYAFVTPRTLAMLGAPSSMNELQLVVRDAADRAHVQDVAREVRKLLEAAGHPVTDVNVPEPGRHIHAGQIDSLLYTQGAFGLLALVLSGLLVVNLISAMLTGQVREIGIMKAIGAQPRQIAAMYLALAFCLGLVASAISIPLAAVFGRAYAELTAGILNFDVAGYRIPVWSFALQLVVGTLLPVFAAAVPVTHGCRISVSDALRNLGIIASSARDAAPILHGARWVPRTALLSIRNAFRRRQRLVLTLVTLSAGGAVYLGAINLRSAVMASVDLIFASQQYDMSFRFAGSHDADSIVAAARSVSRVRVAEAWSGARAAISTPEGLLGTRFPVTAAPLQSQLLVVPVDSGRWLAAGDANDLVVNRTLLVATPELALGHDVVLIIDGKVARWRVVGAADTGPTPMAYTTRETLVRVTGDAGSTSLVVSATSHDGAAQLALVRALRSELGDRGFDVTTSQLIGDQRSVLEDHLLMVAGFLGNMSILMIVVGGLGLASTMSLSVLERTREIGVLRALGAPHRSIVGMVQAEGLVIAVLSWAVAIPLSIPMSVSLGMAFSRVMLKVPVILVPDVRGVAVWLGLVTLLSFVACAWPARRAMRMTTAIALAHD